MITIMSSFVQEESRSISENITWEKENHLLMEGRVFHFPDSLDMTGD